MERSFGTNCYRFLSVVRYPPHGTRRRLDVRCIELLFLSAIPPAGDARRAHFLSSSVFCTRAVALIRAFYRRLGCTIPYRIQYAVTVHFLQSLFHAVSFCIPRISSSVRYIFASNSAVSPLCAFLFTFAFRLTTCGAFSWGTSPLNNLLQVHFFFTIRHLLLSYFDD